ncbi:hypothetical protein DSM14862_02427 [Sulfitobacter indolifex]|uniref:Uncharacterized protein n=1 Tax=Sulfitobacter indolifex HEL-45 TaxID=391624 RepID=A0ABM9X7I0_9RHOB|nr:hypothetical protein [Sulfitobacter indolifex]EDQ05442.1 hypothetical protein OIHEL45_01490 [Sulfitobacter indolifex HEL-45]UOA19619.1 hypothetical protein DSM14862_02427 [Sulfitobacter indolifex]
MAFMPDKPPHDPQDGDQNVKGLIYTKLAQLIAAIGMLGGIIVVFAGFVDDNLIIIASGISCFVSSVIIGVLTDISMSIAKSTSAA